MVRSAELAAHLHPANQAVGEAKTRELDFADVNLDDFLDAQ